MSMGWLMPTVGTRVVERRKARPDRITMPESGWLFRPFVPLAAPRRAESTPDVPPERRAPTELTEPASDRTISAG
jgi:hypothetical protein